MASGENGESFLRQLSLGGGGGGGGGWNYSSPSSYNYHHCRSSKGGGSNSKRWGKKRLSSKQMEEEEEERGSMGNMGVIKKRVMVVIDHSTKAKQSMMWALTHITNKGDLLTLLHVIPHNQNQHQQNSSSSPSTCSMEDAPNLANSLGSLCKACKPEVEVEALVIQGPKLVTVLSQVKKLEATVLVLSQSNPSPFSCLFRSSNEEFVEQCMNKAECLTMAVRKRSKGIGGYLVSTRWQKNFWLLA